MDEREAHRLTALAVPSRRRLLEALEQAPAALAVGELADAVGLHPNTVRLHLDVLLEAGLVVAGESPIAAGPGRRPLRYAVAGGFLGHFVREGLVPCSGCTRWCSSLASLTTRR